MSESESTEEIEFEYSGFRTYISIAISCARHSKSLKASRESLHFVEDEQYFPTGHDLFPLANSLTLRQVATKIRQHGRVSHAP